MSEWFKNQRAKANDLRKKQELTDVCFITHNGDKIYGHKIYLITLPWQYSSSLNGPNNPLQKIELDDHSIEGKEMEQIVDFIYTENFDFRNYTFKEIIRFHKISKSLTIDHLTDYLSSHILTTFEKNFRENALHTWRHFRDLSLRHSEEEVLIIIGMKAEEFLKQYIDLLEIKELSLLFEHRKCILTDVQKCNFVLEWKDFENNQCCFIENLMVTIDFNKLDKSTIIRLKTLNNAFINNKIAQRSDVAKTESQSLRTNLKRHIDSNHKDDINDNQENNGSLEKKNKITMEVNKNQFIRSILKIVTHDGHPFSFLDSEGFKEIVNPIFKELNVDRITSVNVLSYIDNEIEIMIEDIKIICRNRLLSLKIDSASRLDKSIFAVNLQVIVSRENSLNILIKTLGMFQLFTAQTDQALMESILKIIDKYEIHPNQIYSITSDNGENMLKADVWPILDSINIEKVRSIRCPAHTLHLCVLDVHKEHDLNNKVENIRKICKFIRTTKFRNTLHLTHGVPPIDVPTHWNSTYEMINKFYGLKEFIESNSDIFAQDLFIDWDFIKMYLKTFGPISDALIKLQSQSLLLSDFYKIWLELVLQYESRQSDLDNLIEDSLKTRQVNLLENQTILSAVFLDPRINKIMSIEERQNAKKHLKSVAKKLCYLKENKILADTSLNFEESMINSSSSLLGKYLDRIETSQANLSAEDHDSSSFEKVLVEIENFDIVNKRLPIDTSLADFLQKQKYGSPLLFEISCIIQGVPATQVSVERAFSSLNFILDELRTNLDPSTLEKVLLLKLNK